MQRRWRNVLGVSGLFMMADGLISLDVPNDRRPALQAGRVLRTLLGFGLTITALAVREP